MSVNRRTWIVATCIAAAVLAMLAWGLSRPTNDGPALDASTVRIGVVQWCTSAKRRAPINFVCVQTPNGVRANSTVLLFKVVDGGKIALRTNVKVGRKSGGSIEVQQGLRPGERIIISDMSAYENVGRVELR